MLKNFRKKSPDFLSEAKRSNLFSVDGLNDESIEARYLLIKSFSEKYGFHPKLEKDDSGKPIPFFYNKEYWYWSLSHSEHFIAFIVDISPCGIDLAEYEERDESLLNIHDMNDYSRLGGRNWCHFYILWTSKETIIKMLGEKIDSMKEILLQDVLENTYSFEFQSKTYRIVHENHGPLFISSSL